MAIPILMGIAFGFFIGCSTLFSGNKSQSDNPETFSEAELEQRLRRIEEQISSNPVNAEAYYQKGDLLNNLAHRQEAPDNRTDYYLGMQNSLTEAGTLFQNAENRQGMEKVDELLKVSWSYEHNQGVEILQTDSTLNENDLQQAASHFNNAIIIIPDSVVSYRMKARANYRSHNLSEAISTLESARKRLEKLPSSALEQLAYLYLENDQSDMAVKLYEEAESFSDDNLNLVHGLANAYIRSGRHQKAVELLDVLVENEPENIIYLQAYASELYHLGIQLYDSIQTTSSDDSASIQQKFAHADTLLNQAEEQYQRTLELNPDNMNLKNEVASFYQNYAVHLREIKPMLPEKDQQRIEERIKNNLSEAVTHFEELVEKNPDQARYWKNLYQAYSYLGMQEKANEAKAKANL